MNKATKKTPVPLDKPASVPRLFRTFIGIFILCTTVGLLSCQTFFVAMWR